MRNFIIAAFLIATVALPNGRATAKSDRVQHQEISIIKESDRASTSVRTTTKGGSTAPITTTHGGRR